MSRFLTLVLVAATSALAGQVRVDLPGGSGGSGFDWEVLQYDNGTPNWFTWHQTYRGIWFNTQDFYPGSAGIYLAQMEYWFYESASYPWDTAQFYSGVWSGSDSGPEVMLAQAVVTALHYAPCYHVLPSPFLTGQHFWGIAGTELSSGGWPSILADGQYKGLPDHSYTSDDFIVWEPWSRDPWYGDFFIRAHQAVALCRTTWGAVKALY